MIELVHDCGKKNKRKPSAQEAIFNDSFITTRTDAHFPSQFGAVKAVNSILYFLLIVKLYTAC